MDILGHDFFSLLRNMTVNMFWNIFPLLAKLLNPTMLGGGGQKFHKKVFLYQRFPPSRANFLSIH